MLLSAEGAGRLIVTGVSHMKPDDDWKGPKHPVSARGWAKDGAEYVLVVNGYEKELYVTVGLAGLGRTAAESVFGPEPKLVPRENSDSLRLRLAPLEPALVRLHHSK